MVRLLPLVGIALNAFRFWRERQWRRNFFALVKRRDDSPTAVGFTYRRGEPVGLIHAIGVTDRIGLSG
jgi:hypothetical protein